MIESLTELRPCLSKIHDRSYYSDAGQEIHGMEAVSLMVECDTQEEIDTYWKLLSSVPEAEQCGWIKDKFGVSWQIAPNVLNAMLNDKDTEKANRVMDAMLRMKKLNIQELKDAFDGK
ncbi:MAG: VOC family protein [Balneolaceae bacterium]